MSQRLKLEIKALDVIAGQDLVILVSDKLTVPGAAQEWAGEGAQALLTRAAAAERFKGKAQAGLTLPSPEGASYERLIVVGVGPEAQHAVVDAVRTDVAAVVLRQVGGVLGGARRRRFGEGPVRDQVELGVEDETVVLRRIVRRSPGQVPPAQTQVRHGSNYARLDRQHCAVRP